MGKSGSFSVFLLAATCFLGTATHGQTVLNGQEFNRPVFFSGLPDTIPLQDTGFLKKARSWEQKTGTFFDTLEARSDRRQWSRQLHNIVVVSAKRKTLKDTLGIEHSETPFVQYEGRIIRNIRIKKLSPFGSDILEGEDLNPGWFEKAGNMLHFKTRDWVIKKNLLFSTGDPVNPSGLSDNEMILREIPSVEDARIIVLPVSPVSDSVDIQVVVKDQFSYAFAVNMESVEKYDMSVWNRSIFGTGQEVNGSYLYNKSTDPRSGYDGYYRVRNMGGSFIDARIGYIHHYDRESSFASVTRSFVTPSIRNAGGFTMSRNWALQSFPAADSFSGPVPVKYDSYNCWLGHAVPVQTVNWFTRHRSTVVFSGGINLEKFSSRPAISENTLYPLHNRKTLLFSLAFSEQSFYKTNLIYSFGQTEDIPAGSLLKFTAGPEINEYSTRLYTSFSLSKGNFLGNTGYLYQSIALGGFYNQGQISQGILSYQARAFSNLFLIKRTYLRQFASLHYVLGINRFQDELLNLNDAGGIRGFESSLVNGQQKLTGNFESVLFTPYNLIGFRLTFFGFVDLGWIGDQDGFILGQNNYYGLGGGIRLKNERLVFNTFEIRFAWYPKTPNGLNPMNINFYGEPRFRPENFYVKAPEILGFN